MPTISDLSVTSGSGQLTFTAAPTASGSTTSSTTSTITLSDVVNALGYLPLNPNNNLTDLAVPSVAFANLLQNTLQETGTRTWNAGFPGTGNLGIYQALTITGTPSAGNPDTQAAPTLPINLMQINEQLNIATSGPGGGSALQIEHVYGGGSSSGGRNTLLVESQLSGTIESGQFFVGMQLNSKSLGNVVGATWNNPLGAQDGLCIDVIVSDGSYMYEACGMEIDLNCQSGAAKVNYVEGMKIVNYSANTFHAAIHSAGIYIESANPQTCDTFDTGLYFGDPQAGGPAGGNGFPVQTTGTLIYSVGGSAACGLDFSAPTFSTAFIKGPNGFQIDNDNSVHTNQIKPPNGDQVTFASTSGLILGDFKALTGNATNYVELQASSGNPTLYGAGPGSTVGLNFAMASNSGVFAFYNGSGNVTCMIQSVANAVNYMLLEPAIAGSGPSVSVQGSDTNADLNLLPKGAGLLNLGATAATNATTPASFSAAQYLPIKVNGVTKYLPLADVAW